MPPLTVDRGPDPAQGRWTPPPAEADQPGDPFVAPPPAGATRLDHHPTCRFPPPSTLARRRPPRLSPRLLPPPPSRSPLSPSAPPPAAGRHPSRRPGPVGPSARRCPARRAARAYPRRRPTAARRRAAAGRPSAAGRAPFDVDLGRPVVLARAAVVDACAPGPLTRDRAADKRAVHCDAALPIGPGRPTSQRRGTSGCGRRGAGHGLGHSLQARPLQQSRRSLLPLCGTHMVHQRKDPVLGPRPVLGFLIVDDGSTYKLDADYVIGHAARERRHSSRR